MEKIYISLIRLFANIPEIILINIFLIVATYTDCKSMKIYNKFNLVMLITRCVFFVVLAIFYKNLISAQYIFDCLFGGVVLCLAFWIPAAIAKDSIGGDIKFAFNLGIWCGVIPALFIALIATLLNFFYRIIFGKKEDKEFHFQKIFNYGYIPFNATARVPLAPFFYVGYICLFVAHFFVPTV